MALTATGLGSGLDIENLVTKLMAAERAPLENRLIRRETSVTKDISALGSLKSALSDFRTSLNSANNLNTYHQRNVTSTNSAALTVTATDSAVLGSYDVDVSSLADAQSLAVRTQFSSLTDVVGTGTLTFTFGTTQYTADSGTPPNTTNDTYDGFTAKAGVASQSVTIDSSNNTLAGVRDAINAADIGVSAAIVKDSSSYRLLLSSSATGAENSMQIVVSDSGDSNDTDNSGLSQLAFNSSAGTTNVYQTSAATDASFMVNGFSLTHDTNTVSDVITGLTLSLRQVTTESAKITVSDNEAGIKAAIQTFVDGYNGLVSTLDDLTGYDAATGAGGTLQGDFTARSIAGQIRTTLSNASDGFVGPYTRLAEIGITLSSTGSLSIDDSKLSAAFDNDFDVVAGVLTRFADIATGAGISVNSFTDDVAKGSYAVAISSLATNGKLTATVPSAGFPITIDSSTDSFVVTVDGTASGTVTLTNQAYANLSAIASEIQSKINADATLRAAGKGVTVSVSGDDFEVRSNSIGSSSSVALANAGTDTTLTALGLALATTAAGSDLVGTIDGVAGTATGNTLKGAVGSSADGLSLEVLSTEGGTIRVSDGVLDQIDSLLEAMLAANNPLDTRISSLNSQAEEVAEDRVVMEQRLLTMEARYRKQFNALDILLTDLNSTGSFVADQLANIPIPGKTKK